MAARLRKNHQDDIRTKIKVSHIINKLQANLDGTVKLTAGQIQSAKILLDKTMSNAPQMVAQTTEHSGSIKQVVEVRIIDHKG